MERVLFFGDSITWGAVDQIGLGWVNLIRKEFDQDSENNPSVYNLGISGDTTEGLMLRFEVECRARRIHDSLGIVFAIGTNDSRYIDSKNHPEVPLQRFSQNLEQLIGMAKKFTNNIAFIGLMDVDESKTTPIPWSPTKYYTNENIRIYDEAIQSVCDKNILSFVSMRGLIPMGNMPDGLHPDSEGHRMAADKIKSELKNFFKD